MVRNKRLWCAAACVIGIWTLMGHVKSDNALRAAGVSYERTQKWLQVPAGQQFGTVSWVDVDQDGNIYVLRRTPLPGRTHPIRTFQNADPPGSIWTFDSTGKFVREWGKGMAIEGHGLRVDRNGFIWTTDVQGHQVKKFRRDGTLVMTLGKAEVPGNGPDTFNCPTDVLVASNGDIFVTDGYGNQRVVKFNKDGKFLKTWGTKGNGPGQLRLPHAIVQDSRGRLIVADRCGLGETGCTDNRVQIFDTEGKFLEQWPDIKATTVEIGPDDRLYAVTRAGIAIVDVNTGKVLETIEKVGGHGISVDRNGTLYTASPGDADGVQRYMRKQS